MRYIEVLVRKRLGFLMVFGLLLALGVYLFVQLPVLMYPRVNRPRLVTTIRHAGFSAAAFYRDHGALVEGRLRAMEGLELLEARYGANQSSFTMTFDWASDAARVKAAAEAALTSVNNSLPPDLQSTPSVRFFSGENAGYLMLGLSSPTVSPEDLYRLVQDQARPRLLQIEDIDVLEVFNVEDLRATVTLRQIDMLQHGITIQDVNTALNTSTSYQSLGTLTEGPNRLSVSFGRPATGLMELETLTVKEVGGVAIPLKAVADVTVSYTIPAATFIMDGARGVQMVLNPVDGGNVTTMSREARQTLEDLRTEGVLPEDLEVMSLLDPATYINRSMDSVMNSLLLGAVLAMVIVFLTLGEVRNSILIGLSIPVSLVLSFIPMWWFNVSLNLISLGGMALAVGMIVDASIVVMENIHRFRMEERHDGNPAHLLDLIGRAVKEVRPAVVASTLTSILVFLPLSFTAPLTNAILGDQAKVVVYTLGISLVVSLTLVPLLAYVVYHRGDRRGKEPDALRASNNPSERIMGRLEAWYGRVLTWFLGKRSRALGLLTGAMVLLAVVVGLVLPLLPTEIMSPPQSDRLIVVVQSTGDLTSQEIAEGKLPEMNQVILSELGDLVTQTYAEVRGRFNRVFVVLRRASDSAVVNAELQRLFPSDNEWSYNIIAWDPAELPLPITNDLQIEVSGQDETVLVPLLEEVRDRIQASGIYGRVSTSPATGYTEELILRPRDETLGKVPGLSEPTLLGLVRRILGGTQTRTFEHEGHTVTVRATYPDSEIRGRTALANFLIPWGTGAIPLKHFFTFETKTDVAQIATEQGAPVHRVTASLPRGTPAARRQGARLEVEALLARDLTLPAGTSLTYANPALELDQAIRSLFISLGISIGLIFLVLAFQFNSFRMPLIILSAIPLGIIGLVASLFIFRSSLSLNSLLGAILLSGIVVNNSIIIIEFYLARRQTMGEGEAIVSSAATRLRPILITSLTTIFGMLPLAIGLGEGSSVVRPLGIAVSGGLVVSTVLTLLVVPAILSLARRPEDPRSPTGSADLELPGSRANW